MSGRTIVGIIVYALALLELIIFLLPYALVIYKVQRRRFLRGLRKGLKDVPRELRRSIVGTIKEYTSIRFLIRKAFSIARERGDMKWIKDLF